MNNMSLLVLLLILIKACCYCVVVHSASRSRVDFLPGFQGPLPFYLETGYMDVGESENVQLFYYFVKSERSPEKDPLLIWLTGGPGCSGLTALANELGPLIFTREQYNGSLPKLLLSQDSWTKVSNIIFVDSPVGTGFSYAKTSLELQSGDFKQVRDLLEFLKNWLLDHSEFISNSVYVAGDSYSGITVPTFVQEILNGIEEGTMPPINLKGYILGNPVTDPSNENYKIPFAHGMALISDELYKTLERNCGGEYQKVDSSNTRCLNDLKAYKECISGIMDAHVLAMNCPVASPRPIHQEEMMNKRRWLNQNSRVIHHDLIHSDSPLPTLDCISYDHLLSRYWANDLHVREALHVKKGSIGEWQRCNEDIRTLKLYQRDVLSSFKYHVNLSSKGLFRSLIYSGDHDMVVPFLATQAWIRSLNYSIVEEWRPWLVQGQIAGYTRSYSNLMTFATIKGGGHVAPRYKPKECLAMFKRWIDYEPL